MIVMLLRKSSFLQDNAIAMSTSATSQGAKGRVVCFPNNCPEKEDSMARNRRERGKRHSPPQIVQKLSEAVSMKNVGIHPTK